MPSFDGYRVIPSMRTTPYVKHEDCVAVVVNPVHALDGTLDVRKDASCFFAIRRSQVRNIGNRYYPYAVARLHKSASVIAERSARHWVDA